MELSKQQILQKEAIKGNPERAIKFLKTLTVDQEFALKSNFRKKWISLFKRAKIQQQLKRKLSKVFRFQGRTKDLITSEIEHLETELSKVNSVIANEIAEYKAKKQRNVNQTKY